MSQTRDEVLPGVKRFKRDGEVLTHDLSVQAWAETTELIGRLRAARTVSDHIALQKALARHAWAIRRLDRDLKQARKDARAELRVRKGAGDRDSVTEIGRRLHELGVILAANRRRWYAVRAVQDGIVWRLLRFDRQILAVLGLGEPVTSLSDSFPAECAAAEEHWEAGKLAILCDLATCVRSGDLLVMDPSTRDVQVVEVKESDRATESTKQFERLRVKADFLNTGRSDTLGGDGPLLAPAARPRLKTHLSVLQDMLLRARRDGFALSKASESTLIHVFDLRPVAQLDPDQVVERWQSRERRFGHGLGVAWGSAKTYEWNSLDRLRRDERHSSSTTAPYSIFPVDDETAAGLLLGFISYRTVLNVDVIFETLRRRGWTPTFPDDPEAANYFLRAERGGDIVGVPKALAEQLLVELLTVSAFEAAISAASRLIADSGRVNMTWAWSDEERVWL